MAIQFNLLPDVKLEYIKARRTKRLVILSSAVVTGVSLAMMISLFVATNAFQKNYLNDLKSDIDTKSKVLKDEQDLDKILTIQSQLNNLAGLHEKKPAAERLKDYLTQLVPVETSISDLKLDFATNQLVIDGTSKTLRDVNKFVDTLKFTTYKVDGQEAGKPFEPVVLSQFSRREAATYQITLTFKPEIFDNTKTIALAVPEQISTRSTTEKPAVPLFQPQPEVTGPEEDQ